MKTEVLMIGAGTSGLCAAVRLAEAGVKVIVIATGAGSLGLPPLWTSSATPRSWSWTRWGPSPRS